MKLSKSLLPTPRRWPPGLQLAAVIVSMVCLTWLGTILLRTARVVIRGYPPRR